MSASDVPINTTSTHAGGSIDKGPGSRLVHLFCFGLRHHDSPKLAKLVGRNGVHRSVFPVSPSVGRRVEHNEVGLAKIASDFAQAWQSGQRPMLSDCLGRVSDDLRSSLLQQLLPLDAKHRQQAGKVVSVDDYRQICESVGLDPEVCLSNVINPAQADPPDSERTSWHAPQLDVTGDYVAPEHADSGSLEFVVKQGPAQDAQDLDDQDLDAQDTQDPGHPPEIARIGRYRIEKVL